MMLARQIIQTFEHEITQSIITTIKEEICNILVKPLNSCIIAAILSFSRGIVYLTMFGQYRYQV